ncbi:hypothetical protein PR048_003507 [Dryococelus australis]|uniref:Uncharacterized protein n=1 Tax=Dryococelus australis TaxID=614101 RepID=A0ABQ9INT0_9NEOP|nr:hypothetical protein PR048_003507 [Dryococelus australis]
MPLILELQQRTGVKPLWVAANLHYSPSSLSPRFYYIGAVVRALASHHGDTRYPAGSLPDFRRWQSSWTMLLASGFSRGTPISPVLAHQRCSILGSHFMSCLGMTCIYGSQLESPSLGQEAGERYGRHQHACLVPHRSYTQGGQRVVVLARYMGGAATNNDALVFAHAGAQLKKALEVAHKLGAECVMFQNFREAYSSFLNADMARELRNYSRLLKMTAGMKRRRNDEPGGISPGKTADQRGEIWVVLKIEVLRADDSDVSMEQRRNERAEETGGTRENPPTSGIVRHDSDIQKFGSDPHRESNPVSSGWETNSLNATPLQQNNYKERLGYRGQLLLNCSGWEENYINHRPYTWDAASALCFLKHYSLDRHYKLSVRASAGHQISWASTYGALGSVEVTGSSVYAPTDETTYLMKTLIEQDDRHLVRMAVMDCTASCTVLAVQWITATGAGLSASTVRRRPLRAGLVTRMSLRRLPLSRNYKRLSLQWARERRRWRVEWQDVVFSKVFRFNMFYSDGRICVRRYRGDRNLAACIGGIHPGGLNVGVLLRRTSTDVKDVFEAYVSCIDKYARGLRNAVKLITDGLFAKNLQQQYASFHSGFGSRVSNGEATLEDCEEHAQKQHAEAASQRTEHWEAVYARYV